LLRAEWVVCSHRHGNQHMFGTLPPKHVFSESKDYFSHLARRALCQHVWNIGRALLGILGLILRHRRPGPLATKRVLQLGGLIHIWPTPAVFYEHALSAIAQHTGSENPQVLICWHCIGMATARTLGVLKYVAVCLVFGCQALTARSLSKLGILSMDAPTIKSQRFPSISGFILNLRLIPNHHYKAQRRQFGQTIEVPGSS
jgi:hypothetical protein